MWRSIAKASFAAFSRQATRTFLSASQNPNKVLCSKTRVQYLPPTSSVFQITRSFSQNASDPSELKSHPSEFTEDHRNETDGVLEQVSVGLVENGEDGDGDGEIYEESRATDGVIEQVSVGLVENGEDGDGEIYEESWATDCENNDNQVEEEKACEVDVEKLENLLSRLQSSVDGSFESGLDALDLKLREDFVTRVLETPLILGENLILFFRWAMKSKPEFNVTTPVLDALVYAICSNLRKKDAYSLWDLIKELGEKDNSLLNAEILNNLIALLSKLGKGKAAFEVFNKFEELGSVPNAETYYFVIEALCRRSFFDWALIVSEKMVNTGSLPDDEKVGKIISWLCKGKKDKDAHKVYVLAKEKNRQLPPSSVDSLINSMCQVDETVKLALEMLGDISEKARKYAIKQYSAVIHGLCRTKDINQAKDLLVKMIAGGPPPGNDVFNTIINGYSKMGDLGEATEMINLMESRGLKPDLYTYTVVASGYANGGQMEEARKVLSEAKKKHSKLNHAIYHTLISGYCKIEEFDKAMKLFGEMKRFGVNPNAEEYNKLIQSLCLKALDWKTSEKLFEEMKENGLYLNGITRGLIRAVKELEQEEKL